jgi:hypothetical protein
LPFVVVVTGSILVTLKQEINRFTADLDSCFVCEGSTEVSVLQSDEVQSTDNTTEDGARQPLALFTDSFRKYHGSLLMAITFTKVMYCGSGSMCN